MEPDRETSLLRPPLTFRTGFVGHRPNRLQGVDPVSLSKVLENILVFIREEVLKIWRSDSAWYSGDQPAFHALSSLAEGSDRLFAEAAIKLGYALSCPMPFAQEEFEADFAPEKALETGSLTRFRKILDQAEHTLGLTRFELAGDRNQEPESYRAGGKMILSQSDLLIVVWDGFSRFALGGTEDILKEALRMNIPVIWVDALAPHGWMIMDTRHKLPAQAPDGRYKPDGVENYAGVAGMINKVLAVPGSPNSGKKEDKQARRRLSDYYSERSPRPNPAILWKLFGILLGHAKWSSIFPTRRSDEQPETTRLIQGFETKDPETSRVVRTGFTRCDRLSGYYGDFYRSGYILSFLLAALAVGLALFPVVAGWLNHENVIGESILVAAELVTLLGILAIVFRSRSKRWHGRWLDYRLAAEWIRQLQQLAPLGMSVRINETRGHQKSYEHPAATWMAWYVKALERSLGLPDVRLDGTYLKKYLDDLLDLAQDQKAYHASKARSNHLIERKLHRSGVTLIAITIAACSLHLLPLLVPGMHWPAGFAYLLTFLCGFLPALGAALAGINNQGEFKRLSKTSESMHQEYSELSSEIADLQRELHDCTEKPLMHLFKKIRRTAYRISRLMVDELSDWRITYHNRPLDLPV